MKPLNIALFGLPGSGKGTQINKIITKYDCKHIALGNIFREHIQKDTDLGKQIKSYVSNGLLVPDQITINIINHCIAQHANKTNIIFDGFPRNLQQAQSLDQRLGTHNTKLHKFILIDLPKEEVIQRIMASNADRSDRDDDNIQKLMTRIEIYESTLPNLITYYKKQNKLYQIDGTGTVERVFSRLSKLIANS